MNRYFYQKVLGICPWCREPILKTTIKDGRVINEHLKKKITVHLSFSKILISLERRFN